MDGNTSQDILTRKPENVAVYTNPEHDLYLHRSEAPAPGDGECLVHVRATGICGSDIHLWKQGHVGDLIVTGPNGLGHESAGVVIAVGKKVTRFQVGDRVAIECGIPYMKATCYFCRIGCYNACPDVVFWSTPPYHGTIVRYHVHPQEWLYKIPDHMSYEDGSLLEPLSVALAAVERSNLRLGDPLLICGAGPIGIVSLLAADAAGANPVVITDTIEARLEYAKKILPRVQTVRIMLDKSAKENADIVKEVLGQEAKIVLECTGQESSISTAIYSTMFGGTVFAIGCGKVFQTLPFMHMSTREIDLKFQYRYHDTYPRAIGLVASGMINVKPLVTHRFSLEDGLKAFETVTTPSAMAFKVQILDD